MGKIRKVITQVLAIGLLLGILTVGFYGLYIGMGELDKPVSLMKTDSVSNYIEINGFNIRHDAFIDDGVVDGKKTWLNQEAQSLMKYLKQDWVLTMAIMMTIAYLGLVKTTSKNSTYNLF